MKSAMMCFAVRSNIHPTRAPTDTDDDMEGNNKLTPFYFNECDCKKTRVRPSAHFPQTEACLIYDISGGGMHLRFPRKSHPGPDVDSDEGHVASRCRSGGVKITAGGRFAFQPAR